MTDRAWSIGRMTLILYPFGAGAAAINLYFAGLLGSWIGLPAPSPGAAVSAGVLMGLPITWLFARHMRNLIEKAETDGR